MWYLLVLILIQIFVEGLPLSSSGHVHLAMRVLQKYLPSLGGYDKNVVAYVRLAHIPTAIIVALCYQSRVMPLIKQPLRWWRLSAKIICASACATIIMLIFFLFFSRICWPQYTLTAGFLTTGVTLALLWYIDMHTWSPVPYKWWHALILGMVQGCALTPGVSRFAAVFTAARLLKLSARHAFEITWLLQMPLIAGASVLSSGTFVRDYHFFIQWPVIMLIIAATISAYQLFIFVQRAALCGRLGWFAPYVVVPVLVSLLVC